MLQQRNDDQKGWKTDLITGGRDQLNAEICAVHFLLIYYQTPAI